ncbi:MAG: DUF853 domain-containing protein [Propionibacterium sp.]|nr:DUF853 domain-containing protein [Propionibacterium sp.]
MSDFARETGRSCAFDVPSLTIGTLLDEGAPVPGVRIGVPLGMLNRHMLVAGATGTGKTRTLQLLTEGLSAAGTPVLLCDVKGDLTGLADPGTASEKLSSRTRANGQEWTPAAFPVELLSLGGADAQFPGTTVRTSVSDFGPILLARALDLNTTQEQSLQLVFQWADQRGLELVDLADLRAVISFLTSPDGKAELTGIGGVSSATAGVILRALTTLEAQGGDQFFGEPAFDTADLMRQVDGKGVVSLLGVGNMTQRPALVSTVIMWLLADLFSGLPEVGDPERPKLVFFFDEAHLLFADATKEFLRQVVQTVRLIRSKGVGVVFVTQTPKDIPADVLEQLGSRVQHALRAVTPQDQKKLRQTVETFPATDLELDEVLTNLGTGQAVVTVLAPDGRPTAVAPTSIWAPASVMGPAQTATVAALVAASPLAAKYSVAVNPDSAEEKLARQSQEAEAAKERAAQEAADRAAAEKQAKADAAAAAKEEKARQAQAERELRAAQKQREREEQAARRAAEKRQGAFEKALGNAVRSAGTQLGREITRSIFGTRRR